MFTNAFEIIQFIIGIFGSILTISCFLPQCIKILISKNTSGLSLWFLIIAIISSFFWLAIGGMIIASPFVLNQSSESSINSAIAGGIPSIITNVLTLIINTITISFKIKNLRACKQLNMSEIDYCLKLNNINKEAKPKNKNIG